MDVADSREFTLQSTSFDLPIEDREHDAAERSRSSVQKNVGVDHVAIEDSQAKHSSFNETISVKLNSMAYFINNVHYFVFAYKYNIEILTIGVAERNSKFRSTSSDIPIKDRERDASIVEECHDEVTDEPIDHII